MKSLLAGIAVLSSLSFACRAQEGDPAPQLKSQVIIERPIPESQLAPKTIPRPETAEDEAIRKQADTAFSARAADVADDCGATFGARIDWSSISPQELRLANPENNCGAVLDALDQLCTSSTGRQRVGPAIKGIICTAGRRPSIAMHAGTLVYTLDWQSADPAAFAYAWLAAHL